VKERFELDTGDPAEESKQFTHKRLRSDCVVYPATRSAQQLDGGSLNFSLQVVRERDVLVVRRIVRGNHSRARARIEEEERSEAIGESIRPRSPVGSSARRNPVPESALNRGQLFMLISLR
jgi:hypothetical protein